MNTWTFLLADDPIRQRLEGLRQGFSTHNAMGADFRVFLWFVVCVASILLVMMLLARRKEERLRSGPPVHPLWLFEKAMRKLGIGLADRILLIWFVWRAKLPHPTAMLLSPELLETQAGTAADRLKSRTLRQRVRSRIESLAAAAFDTGAQVHA